MRANRPSITALRVSRDVVPLGELPEFAGILPDGFVDTTRALMTVAGYLPPWRRRFYAWRGMPGLLRALDRLRPGAALHLLIRKRYLADQAADAITGGARQLLVIGAGFDTVAYRLAKAHPEILAVEVDRPATQSPKRGGMERAGFVADNLCFVPVDLATSRLDTALAGVDRWDAEARSVVIAEGLLMYLRESEVLGLFDTLSASTGPESRLLLSYVPLDADGRSPIGRPTLWALKKIGEPMFWMASPEDFDELVRARGLDVLDAPTVDDLRARYLRGTAAAAAPLREFERLAVVSL